MEPGDFDQTPAPSGRPSLTTLRTEHDDDTLADAPGISAARPAAFRHHMLKTSTSGPTLVDRDFPAPSAANPSPPTSTTPSQMAKPEVENRGTVPGQPASGLPRQSPPAHLPENAVYTSSPMRLVDRQGVNSSLQKHDTHSDLHHPGLLEGTDFCDNGLVPSPASRSFASSRDPSSPISDISMMSGERHRVLSSGDISVTEVAVPVHRHKGHSIAVKVRPAFSYYPAHHPIILGDQRGLDYSRAANKVQPFDPGVHRAELMEMQDGHPMNDPAWAMPEREGSKSEQRDGNQALVFTSSKIRPFIAESSQRDAHQHYSHELKVRPYTPTADDMVPRSHHIEASHEYPPTDVQVERLASKEDGQFFSYAGTGDFETMPSYHNQRDHGIEQQRFGGGSSDEDIHHSEHPLIHSPIPISKIRPFFTNQPSSSGRESHSSASKAGPVAETSGVAATQDKPSFPMDSGQSLHS